MSILNFGSLNIDHVYTVPHFVRAGESLVSLSYLKNLGGKGFNQSVALARAGARACHAGLVGEDGRELVGYLSALGVDASRTRVIDAPTGHAIIQVDEATGNNSIFTYGGANQMVSEEMIDEALNGFGEGDILLTQNEISNVGALMLKAKARGMRVAFNPSPITPGLNISTVKRADIILLNELEGADLTGETRTDEMLESLTRECPRAVFVLTLGADGAICASADAVFKQPAFNVKPVDTTAAGDTFTGYFISSLAGNGDLRAALRLAAKAAALSVTRPGAAQSIPALNDVMASDIRD